MHTTAPVATYDNYGSLWGHSTTADAEADITEARGTGADIHEWTTIDRDGHPLRVVRIYDPTFLDTISVFTS
ncbi:hypothetical protein [Streptomyces silvensis]|uniref:Uncharacterized protein n=1 Tax=Streptomyces silvensis TaxID=1765722 RepID=A0A0W7X693_9ACTN|nr:hypothetical protein [Streptomyces silvensis]KUF18454.1 hypothetical protein AT728_19095 [Streptomyces silvensis]